MSPSLPSLIKLFKRISAHRKPNTKRRADISAGLLKLAGTKPYKRHRQFIKQIATLFHNKKQDDSLWDKVIEKTGELIFILENPYHNSMADRINDLLKCQITDPFYFSARIGDSPNPVFPDIQKTSIIRALGLQDSLLTSLESHEQLATYLEEGQYIQTANFIRRHTMYIFVTNIDTRFSSYQNRLRL